MLDNSSTLLKLLINRPEKLNLSNLVYLTQQALGKYINFYIEY
jgi:hypothetical protein